MAKKKIVVKVKALSDDVIYYTDGTTKFTTKDERFNLEIPMIKVIKYCIKHNLSFKVGYRENDVIANKNYIEIICGYKIKKNRTEVNFLNKEEEPLKKWLYSKSKECKQDKIYDLIDKIIDCKEEICFSLIVIAFAFAIVYSLIIYLI